MMRLGDKYPIRFKFWCIVKEILFPIYIKIRNLYSAIDEIHYDYWTRGKTIKELKREAEENNSTIK